MTDKTTSPKLTHATGAPVGDNVNIQTAGPRGLALLQDVWLIEKLAHFDREVIPERRMHAKGAHAHGIVYAPLRGVAAQGYIRLLVLV
jgi:catalase